MRRARLLLAAGLAVAGLAGCRDDAVSMQFSPRIGEHYRYRYEVTARLTRSVDGREPVATTVDTELLVDQEVLGRTRGGTRVRIHLTREGGADSTVVAVVDRAGSLAGVELVEGLDAAVFGIGDPSGLAPDPSEGLPGGSLAPGDRWSIDDGNRAGHGRLERLAVVDGHDVAWVRTEVVEALDGAGSSRAADTTGTIRTGSRTSYDIGDGAVRQGRSWSHGRLEAQVRPPADVDAPPVRATISYDVEIRVTRTSRGR
jgi:hypothetical protein